MDAPPDDPLYGFRDTCTRRAEAYTGASVRDAKRAAEVLKKYLKDRFTHFHISDIVMSGSVAHDTAVPNFYDIDLVIYSEDIKVDDITSYHLQSKLKLLKAFIREQEIAKGSIRITPQAVKFKCKYHGEAIDVDLLVSPLFNSKKEFYDILQKVHKTDLSKISVCAAKWQVDFLQDTLSQEIRLYIIRAKAWRNKKWTKESGLDGRPKSYLLSLLVVAAFEDREQEGAKWVTSALIKLVGNYKEMDIYWECKDDDSYLEIQKGYLSRGPRLMDPANPTNNVWISGFRRIKGSRDKSEIFRSRIHTIDLSFGYNIIDRSEIFGSRIHTTGL